MNTNKDFELINQIIHSNVKYDITGSRDLLAANAILGKYGIKDIDIICNLGKIIQNSYNDLEFNEKQFIIIEDEIRKIIKDYYNKSFEL